MRHPKLWRATTVIVAAILIGGVGVILLVGGDSGKHSTDHPDYPYSVQTFADQGRDHIAEGQVFDGYNSNPPTSGPHGPAADWGVSGTPVAKESAVHNMEHGGVVVWYNCNRGPAPLDEDGCDSLIGGLADLVEPRAEDGMFILMTPYSDMEARIALTAWTYLDAFDQFDAARVEAFIASFECKFNPENFCR